MGRSGVDLFNIPNFLIAPSEQRLVRLMLLNNLKKSHEFQYFDIQQKKNGKWVAWYYESVDMLVRQKAIKESVVKGDSDEQ